MPAAARASRSRRRWIALGIAATLVAGGAIALDRLFPRSFLPEPTGPHPIGTAVWSVADDSRREIFSDGDHPRTLTVQAWYPATAHATGPLEPYIRDDETFSAVLEMAGAPTLALDHLAHARTHGIADAAPVGGRFPVVLFASGNLGYRSSNLVQVEELASHGFIVITVDQPGTAGTALLEDGRRIPYGGAQTVRPLVDASLAEPPAAIPSLRGIEYPDGIADYLAADLQVIVDSLENGEAPLGLADRMDLSRIGAFGISLGGVVVSQWCTSDERAGACLFLDAPMTAASLESGLDVPAAWITRPAADMASEGWPELEVRRYDGAQHALYESTRAPAWYLRVPGRKHADFTDAPFGSPVLSAAGLTSPGTGDATHEIMRTATLDFFAAALAGADPGVLGESRWPDVVIEHRDGTPSG